MVAARKTSKITKLLIPVIPIVLMAMGCASESETEVDQANANITGEEAAKELGHAVLAQAGIPAVTREAEDLGIVAWDVYAYENVVATNVAPSDRQQLSGAVAFGIGKDYQVRYAIVVDTKLQKSGILRYDAEKITDEFRADGASQITKEELSPALLAAFDTERKAIVDAISPSVADCASNLVLAAFGATMIVATSWVAAVWLASGVWTGFAFVLEELVLALVVPALPISAGYAVGGWSVSTAIDSLENDCGALLKGDAIRRSPRPNP